MTYIRLTMLRLPVALGLLPALALGCQPDGGAPVNASGAPLGAKSRADYYVVLSGPSAIEALPAGVDPRSPTGMRVTRTRAAEIESEQSALVPRVEELGASVVSRISRVGNALVVSASTEEVARLRRLPGVARVELVPIVYPSLASAIPVIGAPAAWAKSTPLQGDGVTIGIVDSGIDYTHADFGGPGTTTAYTSNDSKIIEPGSFPTTRVVGGWDFVGDDYDPSGASSTPKPDPDPLDCTKPQSFQVSGGHGTHVAGIAAGGGVLADGSSYAGPYEQTFVPTAFKVAPGVAPKAKLWAFKIFGCDGGTTALVSALDRAADPNQDGSVDDRMDVVNASLGSSYALTSAFNAQAVENLTKAGTLLVAAAGNDGQTFFAAAAPAVFPQVLAVAASADNQLVALTVTAPGSIAGDYGAAEGGFTKRLVDSGPIAGELVAASPASGCSTFSNASAIAGKIALVDRGQCQFLKKFQNAVAAGAIAAVVVDDQDEALPFAMGGGDPGQVSIPGVMISKNDGALIRSKLSAGGVTIALDPAKPFGGAGAELVTDFSARGPSATDDRLKPDLAAPGFSIDSARVGSGTAARRSQGTSMASPFVAGAAALVRQAQPGLSPLEVKAALVNAAKPLADASNVTYSTSSVGAGRLAVDRAVEVTATAAADPVLGDVGVSFGSLVVDEPTTVKRSFSVKNHSTTEQSFDLSVLPAHALAGVKVSVSPAKLTVAAGQSQTAELTLELDPAALGNPGPDPATEPTQYQQPRHYLNEASGVVVLEGGAPDPIVVPYLGSVRAAAQRKAATDSSCGKPETGPIAVPIGGTSAHPLPVVTAFELGTADPVRSDSATDADAALVDITAVGVATDLATAASFDEASVFFGVAIAGEWTTPARGPVSIVSIDVDANRDGKADYELRTEALTKDGPYGDVIAASTYDLSNGSQQPVNRRLINMATADAAATYPFHNSVLVLVANLKDLGLSPGQAVFDYAAASESPTFGTNGERTQWATYDAEHPRVDPSKAGKDGRPLYIGDVPVLVDVAPATEGPLELLLLHHTNRAGQRYEVVDLAALGATEDNLVLRATADPSVASGQMGKVVLELENAGPKPTGDVQLSGSVSGGSVASLEPSAGTCLAGSVIDCSLGVLQPGAKLTVTALVRSAEGSESIELGAKADSGLACESSFADNEAKATLAVAAPAPIPELSAHGGCGCRIGATRRAPWDAAAAGLFVALALLRRARGSRRRPTAC